MLKANVERAKQVIAEAARLLADSEPISCAGVMEHAIMTSRDAITADARRRLELLIGRYL